MKCPGRTLREKIATYPYNRREGCLLVLGVNLLFWSLVIGGLTWLW